MRINATDVKPGDRVRGIGLVVDYSEPQDDSNTHLEGHFSVRAEGGGFYQSPGRIIVPNDHRVNVVRSDENFHADRLADVDAAIIAFHSGSFEADVDTFVTRLTEIANRPRHTGAAWGEVYGLVDATDLPTLGADGVLGLLDLLGKYSLVAVLNGEAAALEAGDDAEVTTVDFGYASDVD